MSIALYAGSFDPPTLGHDWVIGTALGLFGSLDVAVAINPAKRTMLSADDRASLLKRPGVSVVACPPSRYVADLADERGVHYLVRGLRGAEDVTHEQALAEFAAGRRGLITVVLLPPAHLRGVSSSAVKALIGPDGWQDAVRGMVSPAVLSKLEEAWTSKR